MEGHSSLPVEQKLDDPSERRYGHTSLRLPAALKRKLEALAHANRKTLSSEIVALLQRSVDMLPDEPGEPVASETAMKALELAEKNETRIKAIEDALRAVYDDKRVNDLPDDVREIFVKLGETLYVP
jgi:hypothetical protein